MGGPQSHENHGDMLPSHLPFCQNSPRRGDPWAGSRVTSQIPEHTNQRFPRDAARRIRLRRQRPDIVLDRGRVGATRTDCHGIVDEVRSAKTEQVTQN